MNLTTLRSRLGKASLCLSLLLPLWFAIAAKGSGWQWWSWRTGLMQLTMNWGVKLIIAAIVLAVLSLIMSLVIKPRRGAILALIALAIPLSGMLYANNVRTTARSLPFIHDVTTNTIDPPMFTDALVAIRSGKSNPVHYVGKMDPMGKSLVSELQQQGYPEIASLKQNIAADQAFQQALSAVQSMDWEIHTNDPDTGIIEATDTTFWYSFKDDVIVRVRGDSSQSTIDIRSLSRIGGSDMGKNAARIKKLTQKIQNP